VPRYLTPCLEDGCPELVKKGRCPDHEREYQRNLNKRREVPNSRYTSAQWRLIRREVLERDGHRCRAEGCDARATEVDHEVPVRLGGTDDMSNLFSLCKPCHSRKTMRELRGDGRILGTEDRLPPPSTTDSETERVRVHRELKERVMELMRQGWADQQIANELGCSTLHFRKWRRAATGTVAGG
jgi:5-methylcytosine-specific restriction protein A